MQADHTWIARRRLYVLGPLAGYILLGLILTWPMALHMATHVPGDGIDDPSLAWNLWWIRHVSLDQPQNPFISDWQFWPVGINLAFYTLTILNGLLSIPLQLVFGLVPAYNLLLLSAFVLGGFGAYLLCLDAVTHPDDRQPRSAARNHWPVIFGSFLGGTLYAFASVKMFYAALGQGNIASSQWIPFAALYLLRMARPTGRFRDAGLAALFLVLQAYAELTYASFVLILALLVFAWGLVATIRRAIRHAGPGGRAGDTVGVDKPGSLVRGSWPLVSRFLLLAVLFLLGVLPFLANMLPDLRAEGDFFASGGGFSDVFSADLAGYALPTQMHPVFGGLIQKLANNPALRTDGSYFPVDKGQQIYLGYVALALAFLGLWFGRGRAENWFWAVAALVFFILTLGPSLRVAGRDLGVPLPFALVSRLPFLEGNRYPSRYAVMLLVSLAPLVALGASALANRFREFWTVTHPGSTGLPGDTLVGGLRGGRFPIYGLLPVALLGLLLFEHLAVPLPLSDMRVPSVYDTVADEPGDFALLEVPPGWRNGARVVGKQDVVIMRQLWYQSRHGKRLLGGNTSRNPEFKFQYFSEDPTLALLIALTNAADLPQHTALRAELASHKITDVDKARARKWASLLNLRYAIVHRDKIPPTTEAALQALLPLTLIQETDGLALYEIAGEPAGARSYSVGSDDGSMVLAEGWSPPAGGRAEARPTDSEQAGVYAQRREARLLLALDPAGAQVRLRANGLTPGQRVTLVVDGDEVASQLLPGRLDWLAFDIPPDPNRSPLSDVRLRFSDLIPITSVAQGPWPIGGTATKSPVSILVRSAGEETGDFAHVYVNGQDVAPNRRGYNLVGIDPSSGRVLASESFDTHGDGEASARIARWVAGLPAGTIVAGAVKDEASMNLGEEALAALRSLGVADSVRDRFRWGHAFVGVTGAPPGTALEAVNGIRPAQVSVGLPVSTPEVAAFLSEVSVRRAEARITNQ